MRDSRLISVVMPFWERQEALDKCLASLRSQYPVLDMEVIIVDDGSPTPCRLNDEYPWPVRLIRLPKKKEPLNPCVPFTEGVKAAKGDVLVLMNSETIHEMPVFPQMLRELDRVGEDAYVLAAAWCPEQNKWHCHTSLPVNTTGGIPHPEGSGLHFCAMLNRLLWDKCGGFDTDYREGAGYDDNDFVLRLAKVGAKFIICDELIVIHPKSGASISWGYEKFLKNFKLFQSKWLSHKKVTICCLNAGNYCGRGAEYVNKLYDMVWRNMPPNVQFRFVCMTDDPSGLNMNIDIIPLPSDLEGWYGKLYFFKRGLFEDGERVIYMDLDTVIVGKLDDLVNYDGQFATLRDFYFPQQVGPAIMSWRVSDYTSSIWGEWVACGRKRHAMGDLWWINNLDQGRFARRCDKLQDLLPGQFVSFKVACHPNPPRGARVVCFHGQPRPHEADAEWVGMAWAIGGSVPADLEVVPNTDNGKILQNIKSACARDLPWLPRNPPSDDAEVAIVAGGPSLQKYLKEIANRKRFTVAVNGAYEYLRSNGIEPDVHMIIDAKPENRKFIKSAAKQYWLASQCDPSVFDKAMENAGKNVTVVHMNTLGAAEAIPPSIKPLNLISSGTTVALAAIATAYCLGKRKFYLYGMDSSHTGDHHAYSQKANDNDAIVEAVVGGKKFQCAPWMIAQVQNFQTLTAELIEDGCEIHVRCEGLLKHVSWLMVNGEAKNAA